MKSKHSAAELKRLALDGAVAACEARAFAAYHTAALDAHNHTEYVEAFVLQLGAPAQHSAILALLAGVDRNFRAGKVAYKPPNAALLTSVLDVGRWVTQHLEGGLAHAALLDRARRGDAGSCKARITMDAPTEHTGGAAQKAMRALEHRQLLVPRAATLELVATRTRLLSDYVTHKTLMGDAEMAAQMSGGAAGLLQLFDRGAQDRKELETLVCAALRDHGSLLAFTSSELLLDRELVALLGEEDRPESARRVDVYLIVEEGAITFDAFSSIAACRASAAAFFKQALRLGLVVGASVKSDLGLRNQRATSGELHLDSCPIVLFALPRVNRCARTLSDVMVYANVCPRFSVATGKIRYLGSQPIKGVERRDTVVRTLASMDEVWCTPCSYFLLWIMGSRVELPFLVSATQGEQPLSRRGQDVRRVLAPTGALLDGLCPHARGRRLAAARVEASGGRGARRTERFAMKSPRCAYRRLPAQSSPRGCTVGCAPPP